MFVQEQALPAKGSRSQVPACLTFICLDFSDLAKGPEGPQVNVIEVQIWVSRVHNENVTEKGLGDPLTWPPPQKTRTREGPSFDLPEAGAQGREVWDA